MSAELLREAAAKMREQAEAVSALAIWRGDESDHTTPDKPFTHHVATFANPAVALAVADLLDDSADKCERRGCLGWAGGGLRCGASFDDHGPGGYRHIYIQPQPPAAALAVARAYLGAT